MSAAASRGTLEVVESGDEHQLTLDDMTLVLAALMRIGATLDEIRDFLVGEYGNEEEPDT